MTPPKWAASKPRRSDAPEVQPPARRGSRRRGVARLRGAARDRVVTLEGHNAPGPAKYDKVKVLQQGSARARHILVLEPGTSAGAPYFRPVAADIVKRLPGWQVWSVERRENLLEDHSVLDKALARKVGVRRLFAYYLGWIGKDPAPAPRFRPVEDASAGFAKRWGMNVAMQDLRRVVQAARRGGRAVVLGGHSLGGNMTAAYATWDFNGRAGARDLTGLVFIDGAGGGFGRTLPTAAEARASLKRLGLATSSPFLDLGFGPWEAGVFNAVGSSAARLAPRSPSILQSWPLLPAALKSSARATNRGGYGYALDTQTALKSLALVQMHIGHLATSGALRDWVDDDELGTVERAAAIFSGIRGMDGTSWYHPVRLSVDGGTTNNGIPNPAQKVLGDRSIHGRAARIPMYAFETSLGAGRVLRSVRALARQSHVPQASSGSSTATGPTPTSIRSSPCLGRTRSSGPWCRSSSGSGDKRRARAIARS
jgi:hypothetical protein